MKKFTPFVQLLKWKLSPATYKYSPVYKLWLSHKPTQCVHGWDGFAESGLGVFLRKHRWTRWVAGSSSLEHEQNQLWIQMELVNAKLCSWNLSFPLPVSLASYVMESCPCISQKNQNPISVWCKGEEFKADLRRQWNPWSISYSKCTPMHGENAPQPRFINEHEGGCLEDS